MISEVIFFATTGSCVWALAPRFFRQCDAVLARRRLRTYQPTIAPLVPSSRPVTSSSTPDTADTFLSAREFNEIARLTRAHLPMSDAVHLVTTSNSSLTWKEFAQSVDAQESVEEVLAQLAHQNPTVLSLHLLRAAVHSSNFVPHALDQAAITLREIERTQGEISVATAQTQLTMRILTLTPIVLLTIAFGVSETFRHVVTTPAVFVLCAIAVALNRIGVVWTAFLIRRLQRPTEIDGILHLVSALSVNVHAGLSLPTACQQLHGVTAIGDQISDALRKGLPFEEALLPLINCGEQFADDVAALLVAAYRDGQPALETIGLLSYEARQQREQHTQTLIRKLPTQLTGPVVLCVLPSFIMLIVVPLIIAQLSTLSVGLPS